MTTIRAMAEEIINLPTPTAYEIEHLIRVLLAQDSEGVDDDDLPERDFIAERAKEQAEREDAADYRRELARFDAEGRGR